MRYLIIEKEKGLFLGAFRGKYLFAKNNIFPITKAPSFETLKEAEFYISSHLNTDEKEYGVIEVNAKDRYISIVEIIKQGYSEYTHEMIDFIPMLSEEIH